MTDEHSWYFCINKHGKYFTALYSSQVSSPGHEAWGT